VDASFADGASRFTPARADLDLFRPLVREVAAFR